MRLGLRLFHSFLIASALSVQPSAYKQQIQQLEDGCIAVISRTEFDKARVHPDQTRAQWIEKWTNNCKSQSAQLNNAFHKGSRAGIPLCGQDKP